MLKRYELLGTLILTVAFTALVPMHQALANNGNGKAPHHAQKNGKTMEHKGHSYKKNGKIKGIGHDDRDVIARYLRSRHQKNCPPGLAKKNNGCLPPGQAKKYRVGGVLPENVWGNVPRDLLDILSPAPLGHRYVQADNDVWLINEATKLVIDAVSAD